MKYSKIDICIVMTNDRAINDDAGYPNPNITLLMELGS